MDRYERVMKIIGCINMVEVKGQRINNELITLMGIFKEKMNTVIEKIKTGMLHNCFNLMPINSAISVRFCIIIKLQIIEDINEKIPIEPNNAYLPFNLEDFKRPGFNLELTPEEKYTSAMINLVKAFSLDCQTLDVLMKDRKDGQLNINSYVYEPRENTGKETIFSKLLQKEWGTIIKYGLIGTIMVIAFFLGSCFLKKNQQQKKE